MCDWRFTSERDLNDGFCNTRRVTGIKPEPRPSDHMDSGMVRKYCVLVTLTSPLERPCFNMARSCSSLKLLSIVGSISLAVKQSLSAVRQRTEYTSPRGSSKYRVEFAVHLVQSLLLATVPCLLGMVKRWFRRLDLGGSKPSASSNTQSSQRIAVVSDTKRIIRLINAKVGIFTHGAL